MDFRGKSGQTAAALEHDRKRQFEDATKYEPEGGKTACVKGNVRMSARRNSAERLNALLRCIVGASG